MNWRHELANLVRGVVSHGVYDTLFKKGDGREQQPLPAQEGGRREEKTFLSLSAQRQAQMWAFVNDHIRTLDAIAADALIKHHRDLVRGNRRGDAARYARLLTRFYEALRDSDELERRENEFRAIGHMTPEERNTFMASLDNSVFGQLSASADDAAHRIHEWQKRTGLSKRRW